MSEPLKLALVLVAVLAVCAAVLAIRTVAERKHTRDRRRARRGGGGRG